MRLLAAVLLYAILLVVLVIGMWVAWGWMVTP